MTPVSFRGRTAHLPARASLDFASVRRKVPNKNTEGVCRTERPKLFTRFGPFYLMEGAIRFFQREKHLEDVRTVLDGNCAPVFEEIHKEACVLDGAVPKGLEGCFMQVGPNPYFLPKKGYHIFDGDGMVHVTSISGGKAVYSNKFVRTEKLQSEMEAGYPLACKIGDLFGPLGLVLIILDKVKRLAGILKGYGTANTAIVNHAGKILALHESDAPYEISVTPAGEVVNKGLVNLKGDAEGFPVTAHPKRDLKSNELFIFGCKMMSQELRLAVLDKAGDLTKQMIINLPNKAVMHDFGVTENYVIFCLPPLVFDPQNLMDSKSTPMTFDPTQPTQFGILPRNAQSPDEVKWIKAPPLMIFHFSNCWEEPDGTLKVFAPVFEDFVFDPVAPRFARVRMREVSIDIENEEVNVKRISDTPSEFPTINQWYLGVKSRFTYLALNEGPQRMESSGIQKIDFEKEGEDREVAVIQHGEGRWGGECFFVPRNEDPALCDGEDDGYLVTYVYDESRNSSELVMYDAKTMHSKPIARIGIPQRVPFGFHTWWVNNSESSYIS